jgi:hypothetical protein
VTTAFDPNKRSDELANSPAPVLLLVPGRQRIKTTRALEGARSTSSRKTNRANKRRKRGGEHPSDTRAQTRAPSCFRDAQHFPRRGFGPWYAFLAYNIASSPQRKTAILVHSEPEWLLDLKNHEEIGLGYWRAAVIIGPFEIERDAVKFSALWAKGSYQPGERYCRGMVMCRYYAPRHCLNIWFRRERDLVLGTADAERCESDNKKRQAIRKERRGRPHERHQRMYELMPEKKRKLTLGATKIRREVRGARKRDLTKK